MGESDCKNHHGCILMRLSLAEDDGLREKIVANCASEQTENDKSLPSVAECRREIRKQKRNPRQRQAKACLKTTTRGRENGSEIGGNVTQGTQWNPMVTPVDAE